MNQFAEDNLPFWNKLTKEEQDSLVMQISSAKYQKGEIIMNPHNYFSGLKMIKSGVVRIFLQNPHGGELMLSRLSKGDICVLSILKRYQPDICAELENESEILTVPENYYLELCGRNQEVMKYHYELILGQLGEIAEVSARAAVSNTQERLACLLLRYLNYENSSELYLTHEMMAKDIGTAREVVTRTLNQFQNHGMVRLKRGSIAILDRDGLKQRAGFGK